MSNSYYDLDEVDCEKQIALIKEEQNKFVRAMFNLKYELMPSAIDPVAADKLREILTDFESDMIGLTGDNIISDLQARIDEIREEDAREDYRAEVRHMTAQHVSLKAAI
ncbi:hypothetical protein [Thalassospira tepidiphila]|uniref:Uncharacterized protein n=2 Tax=Thalassospira tepidiphila TaxID=393657 RepID=A0A853KVR9_9PROT|nr:hypothetical protein [Thalassospira tepidiphila]NJB74592.1 hypothetical protein [Thalassospira tepidiphila]OAZ08075.1 hypothetical protein TH4_18670 [Thalassospira tepidiphila MCCC 1A03514]